MRRAIWIIAPLLAAFCAYGYTAIDGRLLPLRYFGPVLEYPPTLQLGERELGHVASVGFTLRNRGGKDLVIEDIQSSCACSGMEQKVNGKFIRVRSLTIKPHEEVRLAVRVLVQGVPGQPSKTAVSFRSNDPAHATGRIEVFTSRVNAGVVTTPSSVVFGALPIRSHISKVLDVYDSSLTPRNIDRVETNNPSKVIARVVSRESADAKTVRSNLGCRIGRIEVTALADLSGPLTSDLEIYVTGNRKLPTVIPVSGRVMDIIEVSPTVLILPRASGSGSLYYGQCICRCPAGKPFDLAIASISDGLIGSVSVSKDRMTHTLRIEWRPTQDRKSSAPVQRQVSLRATVDGEVATIEVPVMCVRDRNG